MSECTWVYTIFCGVVGVPLVYCVGKWIGERIMSLVKSMQYTLKPKLAYAFAILPVCLFVYGMFQIAPQADKAIASSCHAEKVTAFEQVILEACNCHK